MTEDFTLMTFHSDSYKETVPYQGQRIKFDSYRYCFKSNLQIWRPCSHMTFQSDYSEEMKGFRILFYIKRKRSNSKTIGIVSNELHDVIQHSTQTLVSKWTDSEYFYISRAGDQIRQQ